MARTKKDLAVKGHLKLARIGKMKMVKPESKQMKKMVKKNAKLLVDQGRHNTEMRFTIARNEKAIQNLSNQLARISHQLQHLVER